MPAKLDRCVQRVMKTGKSESNAFAICNAQIKGEKVIARNTLTIKTDPKEKVKDWRLLEFFMPIEEKLQDGEDFIIKGVAITETITLNNVKYVAEELSKAAPSFRNVPILLDHRNEVKNIVGRTTENVDFNSTFNRIDFEAKIMDKDIIEMIKDGRIGSVSIGAKVHDLTEEEDGSMKAIGIQGLELSLVAVPGDSQASLAQAIQQGMVLKEAAKLQDTKLNVKEEIMEDKTITEEQPEEVKSEEEPKEKPKEEVAEEKVQKIDVKVDTTEIAGMKVQIAELKELLMEKKKIKEEAEETEETKDEVTDETKGEVSTDEDTEEKLNNIDNMIVETAGRNFNLYRDYSKENSNTNLKRLVR